MRTANASVRCVRAEPVEPVGGVEPAVGPALPSERQHVADGASEPRYQMRVWPQSLNFSQNDGYGHEVSRLLTADSKESAIQLGGVLAWRPGGHQDQGVVRCLTEHAPEWHAAWGRHMPHVAGQQTNIARRAT